MIDKIKIVEERADYHVHKKFHKHVQGPRAYILKIVGVDCDEKKDKNCKVKWHMETAFWGPNDKWVALIKRILGKVNRRIRKRKLKKRSHEEVEETV